MDLRAGRTVIERPSGQHPPDRIARLASLMAMLLAAGCAMPTPTTQSPPATAPPVKSARATLAPESSGTLVTPVPPTPSDAATATPRATVPPVPAPTYSVSLVWQGGYLPSLQGAFRASAEAVDIAVGGPGFVIVGSDANARGEVGVSWTSSDGIDWQEHDSGIAVASGRSPFASVAAGGGALVAVGSLGIWRSVDGASWDQVGDASMLGLGPVDVAWGPAGFVATGWGDGSDARVWRSADGISWEQVPPVGSLAGFCPARISGRPDGYQVLGSLCGTPPSVVLASSDGLSWAPAQKRWITLAAYLKPVAAPRTTCGGTATAPQMNDVGAFGPGYVAVGISRCGNDEQGAAWTSPDGASWQISEIPTSLAKWPMRAMAVRNGQMIVVAGTPWPDYFPAVFTVGLGK